MTVRLSAIVLLAGIATAQAAAQIPSSELPGRERQRFQESPVDRFTAPQRSNDPLWQWDCNPGKAKGKAGRNKKKNKGC